MLYHLFNSLQSEYSWLNVFRYITFRAMLAFLFSLLFVLFLEPGFIKKLQSIGVKGQPIRDDGPKRHETKQGTPTMGGLVIVAGVALATLLLSDLTIRFVWLALFVLLGYAAIGFVDDWRKVYYQNTKGLSGRAKLRWQFGIALIAGLLLHASNFPMTLTVPFLKDVVLQLPLFIFLIFVMIVVVGASNAVNLTDGLDGLAIGPIMTVAATYAIFAYLSGSTKIAAYLTIPAVEGVSELSIMLAAIVGGGLGFLWYNAYPAEVFMGDVGALAMGGVLGLSAVLVKQELLLIVAGGIFVVEALSVIIQVYSFKLTGKRVFKMAPIHHHFELKGWAEPKIIVRFWIISLGLALVCLTTLKLR